jgi:hypothetical protein
VIEKIDMPDKKYLLRAPPCVIYEDEGGVPLYERQEQTRAKDEPTEKSHLGAQAEEAATAA